MTPDSQPPEVTPPRIAPGVAPAAEPSTASSYLRAIRLHPIAALLVFVATLVGAGASLAFRTPAYHATAAMLVTPLSAAQQAELGLPLLVDTGDTTRNMQTAAALLASHDIAAAAAHRLGGSWTTGAVQRAVDVTPEGDTNLLAITGRGSTPAKAVRIANVYMTSALQYRGALTRRMATDAARELTGQIAVTKSPIVAANLRNRLAALQSLRSTSDPTLSVAERAQQSSATAAGTSKALVIGIAVFAGLVLASGCALLLEILPVDRVRTENDLLRAWPLPVLARVPIVGGRRGDAMAEAQLDAALRNVHRQLQISQRKTRVVLVTSPSRGDGKTTISFALANAVADGGADVVFIDSDARKADAHRVPSAQADGGGLAGTASSRAEAPQSELLIPVADGSRLRTFRLSVDDLSQLRATGIEDFAVKTALRADYVVIDTPALGEVSDALLLVSEVDAVVVVVRIGHTRRSDLDTARDLLRRARIDPEGLVVVGGRVPRPYPYGR
jgi:receptor protein-tyrosine kinase